MRRLLKTLLFFVPRTVSQRDIDHAYLSSAVDTHDLECRMRTLDDRGRNPSGGILLGLYVR